MEGEARPQTEQVEGEEDPQLLVEAAAHQQLEAEEAHQGQVAAAELPEQVVLAQHLLVVVGEGGQHRQEAVEALVPRRVVVVLGVRLHFCCSEAAELLVEVVVPVSAAGDLREVLASAAAEQGQQVLAVVPVLILAGLERQVSNCLCSPLAVILRSK